MRMVAPQQQAAADLLPLSRVRLRPQHSTLGPGATKDRSTAAYYANQRSTRRPRTCLRANDSDSQHHLFEASPASRWTPAPAEIDCDQRAERVDPNESPGR